MRKLNHHVSIVFRLTFSDHVKSNSPNRLSLLKKAAPEVFLNELDNNRVPLPVVGLSLYRPSEPMSASELFVGRESLGCIFFAI